MTHTTKLLTIVLLFFTGTKLIAQTATNGQMLSQVQTAVPFLNITPDSRAGAMGDVGVATRPDANSMYWNPAKYAALDRDFGLSFSFTPWLRKLVNDISLSYLSGFYKLDKNQTIAGSLRYFSLGSIQYTGQSGEALRDVTPNEFSLDVAYSRMLSRRLSGGVAFRYIRSDLGSGSTDGSTHAGTSFAADVSAYYSTPIKLEGKNANWSFGMNISNIGNKITYTDDTQKDFIPTNLRLGTAFAYDVDNYNQFTFAVDMNKLLVPTPKIVETKDANGVTIISGFSQDVSVAQGMSLALYDAPGGMSEKVKELVWCFGAEWMYREQFAIRGGYFYENQEKGNRKYASVGAGFKFNALDIDFAYLISTSGSNNPLAGTIRISGTISFDQVKKSRRR
jgi:hypothetical protein